MPGQMTKTCMARRQQEIPAEAAGSMTGTEKGGDDSATHAGERRSDRDWLGGPASGR